MNRKIIRQRDSYTVTLPIKWIRENRLEKDGEISVEQEDNRVIIQPGDAEKRLKSIEVTLKDSDRRVLRSIIGGLYRAGYDEIKAKLKDPKIIVNLQKAVDSLYGVEMLDIGQESCTIKTIYKSEETDLKAHILKMIHTLKTMREIIYNDLKNREYNSKEELHHYRENIVMQRDLIARMIIQQKLLDNKNFPYHPIAFNIWYMARHYFYMYRSMGKKKKFTQKSLDLLKKTGEHFDKMFSEKDIGSKGGIYGNYLKLLNDAQKTMESPKECPIIASYCINILMTVQSCSSLLLQIEY